MDMKSAFLYGTIEEDVYVTQPPGFKDPDHPDKVYKVVKALYGLHQAPRACQDKYVTEILKKFNYTDVKSACTPADLEKPLVKDRDADDVDVHLYRSMIRYLKGKPTLGLWYFRDSPFELVAYTDSDYAGATQDRKSTIGGCQFLGNRLISWQCKRSTVVATSTTEAEYVAVANLLTKGFDAGRQTAALSINEDGVRGITATIDRKVKVFVSEASIRRHLKLEDFEGLKTLPTAEIFEQLALMGYVITSDNLTFQKGHFSPQWKFLIHTILHCLSPKKTDLCTSLSKKVASLEYDLKQTKHTYNAALTKLINRGRSLIEELDLDAEISLVPPHAADQGRIDDTQFSDQPEEQLGVFSAATALADAARRRQSVEYVQTYTRRRREVSTGSG
ncbi:retrovirus-related pol polyprotein from transposon TNT 1-94 [Tanacetum coccineum]